VKAVMGTASLARAREVLKDKNNSNRPPDKLETRVNHVKWIAQSKRPFSTVEDPGYRRNMKEGRPDQYVPSASTVSRDVKKVFVKARERISKLQEHRGALHFATDCWTSPNRRAYMAVTVRYATDGVITEWLLDIVALAQSLLSTKPFMSEISNSTLSASNALLVLSPSRELSSLKPMDIIAQIACKVPATSGVEAARLN